MCTEKQVKVKKDAPSLNRGLSSNFCWLRNANHVKFTEECVICRQKHVLIKKKKVYKWAKYGFPTTSLSQKKV